MAEQYDARLLGSLPLDISIREGVDNGKPSTAMEPDSEIAEQYRNIARKITAQLALRSRDFSASFPKIVVEES